MPNGQTPNGQTPRPQRTVTIPEMTTHQRLAQQAQRLAIAIPNRMTAVRSDLLHKILGDVANYDVLCSKIAQTYRAISVYEAKEELSEDQEKELSDLEDSMEKLMDTLARVLVMSWADDLVPLPDAGEIDGVPRIVPL